MTNGYLCNFIIVVAKTDPDQGHKGVSLIGVETDGLEGFSRGRNLEKLGMPAQDTAELNFDKVRVPKENLIGPEEGRGFYQLMEQLAYERLIVGVGCVGLGELALDVTVDYVKQREAFGRRIMDFQNTRFKLAECKTKVEVMRSFADRGMEKLLQGDLDVPLAAMIKLWTTETICEIVDDCVQLHGGYGYMMEYPITRLYADVRISRIYAGTNEIQKELVARTLDV